MEIGTSLVYVVHSKLSNRLYVVRKKRDICIHIAVQQELTTL